MKTTFLSVCALLFFSCHTPQYSVVKYPQTPYGLDYSSGRWVLNYIDAPEIVKEKMSNIVAEKMVKHLNTRFKRADAKNLSLPYIPLNAQSVVLTEVKKYCHCDYIINIKAETLKNDIGSLQIGDIDSRQENKSVTTLEVYDVNTNDLIYTKSVSGSILIENSNKDFAFVKSNPKVMVGSLKRILKTL